MLPRHCVMSVILAVGLLSKAHGGENLEARVEAVLQTPGYQNAHWGLLVVDLATGKKIYERNADQMFCPASVTKLFTTSAALDDLGSEYRFHTPVVRRGDVDPDGTLKGDLILIAQGDLCFGGRAGPNGSLLFKDNDHSYAAGNLEAAIVPADPLAGLDQLARQVSEAGIKAVDGDVLIDDRLFEKASSSGSGPARVTPILINDNVVDVVITPGARPGEPAAVKTVPVTSFVTCDAQVETVPAGERTSLEVIAQGAQQFSVRGRVPVGHKPVVKIFAVEDPASFARALLIDLLRKHEVRVAAPSSGKNSSNRLPSKSDTKALPKVAEYTSPPFREYLKVILKVSQNLYASTLPLLVAANHDETSLNDGMKREGLFLKSIGTEILTISLGGGAGGERADLVTPRATVTLLRAMSKRHDFSVLEAALPVLGQDGTLAKAVASDSPARGHARAKTGTYWVDNRLTGKTVLTSKALAGYLDTASGKTLAFVFFLNNVPMDATGSRNSEQTAAAGRVLGKLCEVFYQSSASEESSKARPEAAKAIRE